MTRAQKAKLGRIAKQTPAGLKRADVPDMAVILLSSRLARLRNAVSGRSRELPEGITDIQSLYYLWDIPISNVQDEAKWTSIRLSPQWSVEFGRLQGTFNALFGSTRSEVFDLALDLLDCLIGESEPSYTSLNDFEQAIAAS